MSKNFLPPDALDPKLQQAKEEILAVLAKHDINGAVNLTSWGHGEFFQHFASWSVARVKGGEVRVKFEGKDTEGRLGATMHALFSMRDIAMMLAYNYDQLCDALEAEVGVSHKPVFNRIRPDPLDS